jgi:hypothetical protein
MTEDQLEFLLKARQSISAAKILAGIAKYWRLWRTEYCYDRAS